MEPISSPLSAFFRDFPSECREVVSSLYNRIYEAYQSAVKSVILYLEEHEWHVARMVLGTLLIEPWQALKSAILYPLAYKSHFNFYGLNPTSPEPLLRRPILLIHGNHHNQSAWLALGKTLRQTSQLGPVYTVNLPNGAITTRDYEIIVQKIIEIQSLYGENPPQIDLVGHSRGGHVAHTMALQNPTLIGKVIKLGMIGGTPTNTIYEITGRTDLLVPTPSPLPENQKREINCGHLELIYSSEAHRQILEWLN